MRAHFLGFIALVAACGSNSSSTQPPPDPGLDGGHPASDGGPPAKDAPGAQAGFTIDLGQTVMSPGTVTITAQTDDSGIYAGFYEATSDFSSTPAIDVDIAVANADLATGSYPCVRPDSGANTSVSIQWLDGDMYYTNVFPNPTCTVNVTAASQTSVSAQISGMIYDQANLNAPAQSFTASFVATVGT
jgi:hypothetical protein